MGGSGGGVERGEKSEPALQNAADAKGAPLMATLRNCSGQEGAALGYFKTNAEFWLNLQNFYDLECERRAGKASGIERQVQQVGAE
jgi:hypothetical protein